MAGQKNMLHRRKLRKENAETLYKERQQRSNKDQLKLLDQRLGKNVGAKKERARLTKLIQKEKTQSQGDKKNVNA